MWSSSGEWAILSNATGFTIYVYKYDAKLVVWNYEWLRNDKPQGDNVMTKKLMYFCGLPICYGTTILFFMDGLVCSLGHFGIKF